VEVVKSIIMIEKEMPIKNKSITRYRQDFDNEELEDSKKEKNGDQEERNKRSF
jgi:hypothetical protein